LRRKAFAGISLGFILQVVPLPAVLALFRPSFAVLMVIFWSISSPTLGGIGLGFAVGLALDAYLGVVLGQHALATSLIAYVAIRQHLIIRNKPMFEQALYVGGLLLLWELVILAINGWTGHAVNGWIRLLPVVVGTVLWPVVIDWLGIDPASSRR